MKKLIYFLVYSLILLIIGRSLTFLPQFNFKSDAQKNNELKVKVQNFVTKEKGTFSIYYKDLKSGNEFGIYENKVMTGASLNKIMIVAYLYNLAWNKRIDLEDKIVMQESDIQDYGTGSLRYEDPGGAYTLKKLTQLTLQQSDNTAAHLISIKVSLDKIQNYTKELKLSSTDMIDNKTSAHDMGKILELIYTKKITSSALTRELLDFMKDTDFEDRIPRYIKDSATIYHKTGDAIGMTHDAAIIDDGKNPYILTIMTSDFTDEEKTKDAIGKIAKIIYDNRN